MSPRGQRAPNAVDHSEFQLTYKTPNAQYNIAAPNSLPVRIATFQRHRMYERFLSDTRVALRDTILDVGVTSDRSYTSSNYVEAWYPEKS